MSLRDNIFDRSGDEYYVYEWAQRAYVALNRLLTMDERNSCVARAEIESIIRAADENP